MIIGDAGGFALTGQVQIEQVTVGRMDELARDDVARAGWNGRTRRDTQDPRGTDGSHFGHVEHDRAVNAGSSVFEPIHRPQ